MVREVIRRDTHFDGKGETQYLVRWRWKDEDGDEDDWAYANELRAAFPTLIDTLIYRFQEQTNESYQTRKPDDLALGSSSPYPASQDEPKQEVALRSSESAAYSVTNDHPQLVEDDHPFFSTAPPVTNSHPAPSQWDMMNYPRGIPKSHLQASDWDRVTPDTLQRGSDAADVIPLSSFVDKMRGETLAHADGSPRGTKSQSEAESRREISDGANYLLLTQPTELCAVCIAPVCGTDALSYSQPFPLWLENALRRCMICFTPFHLDCLEGVCGLMVPAAGPLEWSCPICIRQALLRESEHLLLSQSDIQPLCRYCDRVTGELGRCDSCQRSVHLDCLKAGVCIVCVRISIPHRLFVLIASAL